MLTANTYGKQEVHVVKVDRRTPEHRVMDVVVRVLLTGRGLAESYTQADNRMVVPTDTIKNVIYVVAKQCAMNTIEEYGISLTAFFLKTYAHIDSVEASLVQTPMSRLMVGGKPHAHSFQPLPVRWTAVVQQKRGGLPVVRSGVRDLVVMKTTGSGWDRYHECKYTSLKPTKDRILKTSVVCEWTYMPVADPVLVDYAGTRTKVMDRISDVFASRYSPGVQATQYEMGTEILNVCAAAKDVSFVMPNQHNWEYDLGRFGLDNPGEVYYPPVDPTGYITCTVSRPAAKL